MQRMRKLTGDVVVVGAGVAGCSAFYHLARLNRGNPAFKPILVDALPPLSLTRYILPTGSFPLRRCLLLTAVSMRPSLCLCFC